MLPDIADIIHVLPNHSACKFLPDPICTEHSLLSLQDRERNKLLRCIHCSHSAGGDVRRTRRIGTEMFVFNQESALCLRLATNLSNHKVHSVLVISYPGSKKDQQTRGHQVDQPCHLNIGRCFLDRMPHITFYTQHALYASITEELGEPLGQSCAHRQTLLQRELKLASLSSRRLSGYSIVRATSTIGSASG
jgi:hypothetical protein